MVGVFFFKIFLLTGLIFLPTGPRTIYAGPLFLQPELYRDENLDGIQLLFAYSMICSVCVCVSSLICLWSVTREMRMTPESQTYDYKDININIMYLQVSELSVYLIWDLELVAHREKGLNNKKWISILYTF